MKVICETCSRFIRYEAPFNYLKVETEPCPHGCEQSHYTLNRVVAHQALLPLDFQSWVSHEKSPQKQQGIVV